MEPINNSNIDERLAAIAMNLELLSRDREDDKRRIEALLEATANLKDATARNTADIQTLTSDIQTLKEVVGELTDIVRAIAKTTDARLSRLEQDPR
jgi:DNA repair exonuclease SbcCD ATPase subunit